MAMKLSPFQRKILGTIGADALSATQIAERARIKPQRGLAGSLIVLYNKGLLDGEFVGVELAYWVTEAGDEALKNAGPE